MTTPSLLPSLPPKGEPGLARVVTLAARIAGSTALNVRCSR